MHLLAVIPVHLADQVDFLLSLFVNEMLELGGPGICIHDSSIGQDHLMHGRLLKGVLDLMARRKVCLWTSC